MCGCLSHAPHRGTWPTTQACALLVIDLATFWFTGQCSIY